MAQTMVKTDGITQALESIESTAALLLIVTSDGDMNVKGLVELLNTHACMLYEAHETLAGCFSDEAANMACPAVK